MQTLSVATLPYKAAVSVNGKPLWRYGRLVKQGHVIDKDIRGTGISNPLTSAPFRFEGQTHSWKWTGFAVLQQHRGKGTFIVQGNQHGRSRKSCRWVSSRLSGHGLMCFICLPSLPGSLRQPDRTALLEVLQTTTRGAAFLVDLHHRCNLRAW